MNPESELNHEISRYIKGDVKLWNFYVNVSSFFPDGLPHNFQLHFSEAQVIEMKFLIKYNKCNKLLSNYLE